MNANDEMDLRGELAEITAALRAYVEWQGESGAVGLPRDPEARKRLRQAALSQASTPPPGPDRAGPSPHDDAPQEDEPHEDESHDDSSEREPATQAAYASDVSQSANVHPPPAEQPARQPDPFPESPIPARASELEPEPQKQPDPQVSPDPAPGDPTSVHQASSLPNTLPLLEQRVRECTACELSLTRTNTVFSRGSGSSGLCFVGEGPGADEDAQGAPFVGKAGQLLDRMIAAMGFDREEVYVMNIVKCRPPDNRKPHPREMTACSGFLHRQLELLQPEIIVALGATAVEGLVGQSGGITRIRGKFRLYQGRIAVMPTFHPAYLLRNPSAKRDVWNDLRQVVQHMGRSLPP